MEEKVSQKKVLTNKRKQKKKSNLLKDVLQLLEMGLNMVVTLYMFLVIVVMPFYFTDGYARIGTDKHEVLYGIATKVGVIFFVLLLFYLIVRIGSFLRQKKQATRENDKFLRKMSVTDWFALIYGVVVFISYLLSDYREKGDYGDALMGTNRWYMGLVTQLIFVGTYFAVSRFWKKNKWLPALWFPVTLGVFLLGYLNRFEIRPLKMKNATVEFISTIGNINWYCGYIVIIFFGILYYIWTRTENQKWVNVVFGIWVTLGFGTLLTQGSRSGIVALGVCLMVLYMLSIKNADKLQSFLMVTFYMGAACVGTYCIRYYWSDKYGYPDALLDLFTYSPLAYVILGGAIISCLCLAWLQKRRKSVNFFKGIGYIVCGLVVVAFVAFIILGVKNTVQPGSIGSLSEYDIFIWGPKWGSNRGATWAAGWLCFADQDFMGKLFGVGPDCMAMYIHSGVNQELLTMIKKCFNTLLLTNAHNEWLTTLVNTGLLGMLSFVGLTMSAIVRYLKAGEANPMVGACGFAVLAYTANNFFGFQQSLNGITIFLVLGIGEAYMHKK